MTTSVDSTGSSGSAKKFYRAAENRFVDTSFFSPKNLDRFQDLLSVCCTLTKKRFFCCLEFSTLGRCVKELICVVWVFALAKRENCDLCKQGN